METPGVTYHLIKPEGEKQQRFGIKRIQIAKRQNISLPINLRPNSSQTHISRAESMHASIPVAWARESNVPFVATPVSTQMLGRMEKQSHQSSNKSLNLILLVSFHSENHFYQLQSQIHFQDVCIFKTTRYILVVHPSEQAMFYSNLLVKIPANH